MTKYVTIKTGSETLTDKDGNKRELVHTRKMEVPRPCKQCQKEPRALNSSRCAKCSSEHAAAKVIAGVRAERLQEKIINQQKTS